MQGAMRRMSISTGQASAGVSGTSKELLNSTEPISSSQPQIDNSGEFAKGLCHAATGLRHSTKGQSLAKDEPSPADPGPGHNNPFADVVWERKTRHRVFVRAL